MLSGQRRLRCAQARSSSRLREPVGTVPFSSKVRVLSATGEPGGGPRGVNGEEPETLIEGNEFEKPKREPAPVQQLVIPQTYNRHGSYFI